MKRYLHLIMVALFATMLTMPLEAVAQQKPDSQDEATAVVVEDVTADEGEGVDEPREGENKFKSFVSGLVVDLIFLGYIAMIIHMIYVRIWRRTRYRKTFSVDEFIERRKAVGMDIEMAEGEYSSMMEPLMSVTDTWKRVEDPETEEEEFIPTKKKHLKIAIETIKEVEAKMPTDQDIVYLMNEYAETINYYEKRHFAGSKAMIWITLIAAVGVFFLKAPSFTVVLALCALVYYLASMRPAFMLVGERGNRVGFMNTILGGVFGFVGSAQVVRTTTTYYNGSTSVDDDYSEHWIFLIIGIAIFIALLCFLWAIAVVNYLRNYILYW